MTDPAVYLRIIAQRCARFTVALMNLNLLAMSCSPLVFHLLLFLFVPLLFLLLLLFLLQIRRSPQVCMTMMVSNFCSQMNASKLPPVGSLLLYRFVLLF